MRAHMVVQITFWNNVWKEVRAIAQDRADRPDAHRTLFQKANEWVYHRVLLLWPLLRPWMRLEQSAELLKAGKAKRVDEVKALQARAPAPAPCLVFTTLLTAGLCAKRVHE